MEEFDWKYYVSRYSDLRDAGIINKTKAISHWNRIGRYEKRYPNRKVEDYQINKKKNEYLKSNQVNYKNEQKSTNIGINSYDSTNAISLKEIKNMYSNAKMEFTRSEQSSEFQSYNNALIQDNNNKINLLLNNVKLIYNEVSIIKDKLDKLELNSNLNQKNDNLNQKNDNLNQKNDKDKKKSEEKIKIGIDQKIISSDEYSEEIERDEIKYSNSEEYIDNEIIDDDITEKYNNLKFYKSNNSNNIPIDEIDKIVDDKKLENEVTVIDNLIKNINVNDKVKNKKKLKKKVSINKDVSSDESSESINKNLKEIGNIEQESILNKILIKGIDETEDINKTETNKTETNKNTIANYLKTSNLNEMTNFDNEKINKLINNISPKKI